MITKFIVFFLVYMSFQHLLLSIEIIPYFNIVSDIQGYKFNAFKDLNNNFTLKVFLLYFVIYIFLLYITYYFIIKERKTLLEGFMYMSSIYFVADFNIFTLFDKAVPHLPALCYDTFIAGGLCMVISQYLFYNYYDLLKKYIWILFILSLVLACYIVYQYNPDLSNIKGVVLF